jgi:hypothetical protein
VHDVYIFAEKFPLVENWLALILAVDFSRARVTFAKKASRDECAPAFVVCKRVKGG